MSKAEPTAGEIAAAQALLATPKAQAHVARAQAEAATATVEAIAAAVLSPKWRPLLDALDGLKAGLPTLPFAGLVGRNALRALEQVEAAVPQMREAVTALQATAEGLTNG